MIKFLDLQKINAKYAAELKQVSNEVIDSGWFLMGEKLNKFEADFAEYNGKPISVNSYAIKKYGFLEYEEEIVDYVLNDVMPSAKPIKLLIDEFVELHKLSERGIY